MLLSRAARSVTPQSATSPPRHQNLVSSALWPTVSNINKAVSSTPASSASRLTTCLADNAVHMILQLTPIVICFTRTNKTTAKLASMTPCLSNWRINASLLALSPIVPFIKIKTLAILANPLIVSPTSAPPACLFLPQKIV